MRSNVTTKTGDQGSSQTLGGDTLSKGHPVLESTGQLDALRAHTALLRLRILECPRGDAQELGGFLFWLLHTCFLVGSAVNDPKNRHPEWRKGDIGPHHLEKLELEQRRLEQNLRLPEAFIVSASNSLSAQVDVVATVARNFERSLARLKEAEPEFEATAILAFVNRLSDYLYVLARYLEDGDHQAIDYAVLED